MMLRPVLYSFRRCPYAMRARLALKYAGISVELREIVLRDKPADMLAISPKGTVPVLQLADGRVIDESLDIMRWALARSDPEGWLVQGNAGVGEELVAINDGPFKPLLDRYKYAERHPEKSRAAWRRDAIDVHIATLETRLHVTRYLLGDDPALADMAIMPFVRQFAGVEPEWFAAENGDAPFPALSKWLDALTSSTLFVSVMGKHPAWKPGDPVMLL